MSARLALLRHGKTEGNLRGAYIGTTDQPLCEQGIEELRGIDVPVADLVVVSPLLRCLQTAELLYPGVERVTVPGLRERDFGEFEDLSHSQIITLPGHSQWGMDEAGMVFPGGEGSEIFFERARTGFSHALELIVRAGVRDAAIITHGGVIMAALSRLMPEESPYRWQVGCGHGWLLSIQPDSFSVLSPL